MPVKVPPKKFALTFSSFLNGERSPDDPKSEVEKVDSNNYSDEEER